MTSNLLSHAVEELERLEKLSDEPMDDMTADIHADILRMIKIFSQRGHSGSSAEWTINVLFKLLNFENLTELTSDSDEWIDRTKENGGKTMFQSKRKYSVFTTDTTFKTAYDLEEDGRPVKDIKEL